MNDLEADTHEWCAVRMVEVEALWVGRARGLKIETRKSQCLLNQSLTRTVESFSSGDGNLTLACNQSFLRTLVAGVQRRRITTTCLFFLFFSFFSPPFLFKKGVLVVGRALVVGTPPTLAMRVEHELAPQPLVLV